MLILVGILSMGALGGYGWAMDKYRSNTLSREVLQRAANIKNQLDRRKKDFSLAKFENNSLIGYPIGLAPTTDDNVNLDGPHYVIGIQVDEVPGRVCQMTFDGNIGLFDIKVENNLYPKKTDEDTSNVCSAKNTMIFYVDDTWEYDRNKIEPQCREDLRCLTDSDCFEGYECNNKCCEVAEDQFGPCDKGKVPYCAEESEWIPDGDTENKDGIPVVFSSRCEKWLCVPDDIVILQDPTSNRYIPEDKKASYPDWVEDKEVYLDEEWHEPILQKDKSGNPIYDDFYKRYKDIGRDLELPLLSKKKGEAFPYCAKVINGKCALVSYCSQPPVLDKEDPYGLLQHCPSCNDLVCDVGILDVQGLHFGNKLPDGSCTEEPVTCVGDKYVLTSSLKDINGVLKHYIERPCVVEERDLPACIRQGGKLVEKNENSNGVVSSLAYGNADCCPAVSTIPFTSIPKTSYTPESSYTPGSYIPESSSTNVCGEGYEKVEGESGISAPAEGCFQKTEGILQIWCCPISSTVPAGTETTVPSTGTTSPFGSETTYPYDSDTTSPLRTDTTSPLGSEITTQTQTPTTVPTTTRTASTTTTSCRETVTQGYGDTTYNYYETTSGRY